MTAEYTRTKVRGPDPWNKDSQKIRYNPEDPKDNCTEYVYKNKMGISDIIGGISFLLIMTGIVLVICLLFKSRL